MNKKILATLVGAITLSPGLALAQSELYGKMDLSLDQADNTGATENVWLLNSNESYFGVRGENKLHSDSMSVFYQVEFGIHPDQTVPFAATVLELFTARETFLGLNTSFGSVRAGRFGTPMRQLSGLVDQFNDHLLTDMSLIMVGDWRAANIVEYTSPELADMITVKLATVVSEGQDNNDNGVGNFGATDNISSSVHFDLGDFFVAVGYDRNNYGQDGTNGFEDGLFYGLLTGGVSQFGNTVDSGVSNDIVRVVAGANLDAIELGVLVQQAKDVTDSDLKDQTMQISGAFALSERFKIKAQVGETEGKDSDVKVRQMSLGADYMLGKQTRSYVYGTEQKFDGDRTFSAAGVGLEHKF